MIFEAARALGQSERLTVCLSSRVELRRGNWRVGASSELEGERTSSVRSSHESVRGIDTHVDDATSHA